VDALTNNAGQSTVRFGSGQRSAVVSGPISASVPTIALGSTIYSTPGNRVANPDAPGNNPNYDQRGAHVNLAGGGVGVLDVPEYPDAMHRWAAGQTATSQVVAARTDREFFQYYFIGARFVGGLRFTITAHTDQRSTYEVLGNPQPVNSIDPVHRTAIQNRFGMTMEAAAALPPHPPNTPRAAPSSL
jgi:hypothetical protein